MLVTIIGIEIKSGSFTPEGKSQAMDYNNLMVYGMKDNTYTDEKNMGIGSSPITLKIKNKPDTIKKVFGFIPATDDLENMVGQAYEFYFNEKGAIDKIVIPETSSKPSAEKKGA